MESQSQTPTGKAREEKRGERIFVHRFNKTVKDAVREGKLQLPFNVIFKDSNGNLSKEIPDVTGMRVLKDVSRPSLKNPLFSPLKTAELKNSGETTSKSDITLIDTMSRDVAWISHKYNKNAQGKTVDSHAQYMHAESDKKFNKKFKNGRMMDAYEEINEFKKKMLRISINRKNGSGILCWPVRTDKVALTVWDNIKSKNLMGLAIFGVMFGDYNYGRQNCNVILYGEPVVQIDTEKNTVYLSSTKKSIVNNAEKTDFTFDEDEKLILLSINARNTKLTLVDSGKRYEIRGVGIWVVYKSKKSRKSININDITEYAPLISTTKCFIDTGKGRRTMSPESVSPKLASPKPTSPKPTSPKPTSPKPTSQRPVSPKPMSPKTVSPKTTSPKPVSPKPTSPKPASMKKKSFKQKTLFNMFPRMK